MSGSDSIKFPKEPSPRSRSFVSSQILQLDGGFRSRSVSCVPCVSFYQGGFAEGGEEEELAGDREESVENGESVEESEKLEESEGHEGARTQRGSLFGTDVYIAQPNVSNVIILIHWWILWITYPGYRPPFHPFP